MVLWNWPHQPGLLRCPACVVLWHVRDDLLHCAVWRVPSPGCAGPAVMEPGTGLPPGAPQVHEHRWTHDPGGSEVRLKKKTRRGKKKPEEEMYMYLALPIPMEKDSKRQYTFKNQSQKGL